MIIVFVPHDRLTFFDHIESDRTRNMFGLNNAVVQMRFDLDYQRL